MPELRFNPISREWVIIATERAKRPGEFMHVRMNHHAPAAYIATCPFCAGNEHKTSEERLRVNGDGGAWKIRVVANRFPALSPIGEKKRTGDVLKRLVTGVGIHEVIVENPRHDIPTALLDLTHLEELIGTYKSRFIEAGRDERAEHVIVFKNSGEGSGTTIEHPHTQIIATPVVPVQFRERVQAAMHYYDDTGECLSCSVLKREGQEGVRVIFETEHFLTFMPYAALSPFHTWIFPKRHCASFAGITDAEIPDMALHLKTLLSKFHWGLDNPDFNYVIRSSRPQDISNDYCHWYLSVMPRLSKVAGFELGSGIFINSAMPEESADFLRKARME